MTSLCFPLQNGRVLNAAAEALHYSPITVWGPLSFSCAGDLVQSTLGGGGGGSNSPTPVTGRSTRLPLIISNKHVRCGIFIEAGERAYTADKPELLECWKNTCELQTNAQYPTALTRSRSTPPPKKSYNSLLTSKI